MANKCLVTKLKSAVDNSKLQKLNYQRINFLNTYSATSGLGFIVQNTGHPMHIIVNEGNITFNNTVYSKGDNIILPLGWPKIIADVGSSVDFLISDFDTPQFMAAGVIDFPYGIKGYIDLLITTNELGDFGLTFKMNYAPFDLPNTTNIKGFINMYDIDFNKINTPNLAFLEAGFFRTDQKAYNLSEFVNFGNQLTSLNIKNSDKYVIGSVESLATAYVANNRTNGTLKIICSPYITYEGSILGYETLIWITFDPNYESGYQISRTNPNT